MCIYVWLDLTFGRYNGGIYWLAFLMFSLDPFFCQWLTCYIRVTAARKKRKEKLHQKILHIESNMPPIMDNTKHKIMCYMGVLCCNFSLGAKVSYPISASICHKWENGSKWYKTLFKIITLYSKLNQNLEVYFSLFRSNC